jgi:putative acetyltransferase
MVNTCIRLADPSESPAIALVLRHAFLEYEARYAPDAFAATTPTAQQIEQRWGEGPTWVAELSGGGVVGTIAAVPRSGCLYLRSMAIVPGARGRRLGWALLETAERFARDRRLDRMVLSTTPFLDRAIGLYERYGFQRCGGGPDALHGTPLVTMAKRVVHRHHAPHRAVPIRIGRR